ncbi:hypothetical protein FMEAI12_6540003 [Parafrankia sp. Ea1.12]|nr:hypothetical protein FMEAI12_6540003 [Parafrankia sp. Ea1.12]
MPARAGFATKPLLALDRIRRFWVTHRQLGWVAGDEVYGADPELRDWLEEHRVSYVLAVKKDTEVTTTVGRRRVDTLATKVPARAWETYSCADDSKDIPGAEVSSSDLFDVMRPGGCLVVGRGRLARHPQPYGDLRRGQTLGKHRRGLQADPFTAGPVGIRQPAAIGIPHTRGLPHEPKVTLQIQGR